MRVALESPDQPEVIQLITDLDAYQDTLYPPESRHSLDLASLKQNNVLFAVARDASGHAIGCGAIVLSDGYGEVKRMYVHPRSRGQGVAKQVLALLEAQAEESGCTHPAHAGNGAEAAAGIGLVRMPWLPSQAAFRQRYRDDPLSVFMQKGIGAQDARA